MILVEQTTAAPESNNQPIAFLNQIRDLLDGIESGEYEMQDASLNFPIAETSAFDKDLPLIEQTGHVIVSMLLYKRPD